MPLAYRIPNLLELAEGAAIWRPTEGALQYQTTIPHDKKLHKKLRIKGGRRIWVFAGSFGDWANALAEKAIVHYTDVLPEMVAFARNRFPGSKIRRFSVADALNPRGKHDWFFSFEPEPLLRTALPITLRNAIANTKSAKIVDAHYCHYFDRLSLVRFLDREYSLKAETTEARPEKISCRRTDGGSYEREHYMTALETTPISRKRAALDLKLTKLLQNKEKVSLNRVAVKPRNKENECKQSKNYGVFRKNKNVVTVYQ